MRILHKILAYTGPNLIVGRAISVMAEMSGIKIPEKPTEVFWKVELPHLLENRLTEPEFKTIASFDFLVLDEAQDLLARPNLWQCLTQFLSGGISKGAFALFGDFENQVLTERNSILNEFKTLVKYDRPVRWKLTENCRNYRIVGDTAVKLAGIDQNVYSGYLRTGGSLKDYDIHFYSNSKEQIYKLRQYINEFKKHGYLKSEITILSFRADNLSAAHSLKESGYKLLPAWMSGNFTKFTSVHAFKGMENKVIILTDVALDNKDFHRDLFYTGMTRATESVRVLCYEKSKATILNWLMGERADEGKK